MMQNQAAQLNRSLIIGLLVFFLFQLIFLVGYLYGAQVAPDRGLVYNLISFEVYLIGSILAILLGTRGFLVARRDSSVSGRGWSLAGVVLGTLVLIPMLVGFCAVVFTGSN